MKENNLKIAVIGGGITGLYISLKLSQQGHDVSVFDKKSREDLGHKCCSTLVSERIRQFIPITDECIENVIDSCVIHFPGKDVKLDFKPKHLVLNRREVVSILLKLNEISGVKILLDHEIKELPQGYDRIIGCDGALSSVRKMLDLSNPKMKLGLQFFLDEENHSNITETYLSQAGFSWRIPRGKQTECGFLGEPDFAKRELEKQFGAANGLSGALVPCPGFSLFDSGLIMSNRHDVALCGDAMGLTKPWSGGGIIWGLYAADILIKTFPDFKEYEKEISRFFGHKIRRGIIANKLVRLFGARFPCIIPSTIKYDNDFPSLFNCF